MPAQPPHEVRLCVYGTLEIYYVPWSVCQTYLYHTLTYLQEFISTYIFRLFLFVILFRSSCGIDLGSTYVITGGKGTGKTQATVYNSQGWSHDLPQLNEARYDHACARFNDENGHTVNVHLKVVSHANVTIMHIKGLEKNIRNCPCYFRCYWSQGAFTTPGNWIQLRFSDTMPWNGMSSPALHYPHPDFI